LYAGIALTRGLENPERLTGISCQIASSQFLTNSFVITALLGYIRAMTLRDQVETLLPNWERWYPSLFDAAFDLGIIKAEVCDPDSLMLTRRHAKVRQRAADAHREKWGGKPQE